MLVLAVRTTKLTSHTVAKVGHACQQLQVTLPHPGVCHSVAWASQGRGGGGGGGRDCIPAGATDMILVCAVAQACHAT